MLTILGAARCQRACASCWAPTSTQRSCSRSAQVDAWVKQSSARCKSKAATPCLTQLEESWKSLDGEVDPLRWHFPQWHTELIWTQMLWFLLFFASYCIRGRWGLRLNHKHCRLNRVYHIYWEDSVCKSIFAFVLKYFLLPTPILIVCDIIQINQTSVHHVLCTLHLHFYHHISSS